MQLATQTAQARHVNGDDLLDIGIMFFGDESNGPATEHYATILAAARQADELGMSAVWTPERHYDGFGGYFPNPAVLGGALAQATSRIDIRAGSVVGPLHEAIEIVEQWSIVDNLSAGRVGLAIASGWSHLDYWATPERFAARRELVAERIRSIRNLWQGQCLAIQTPIGSSEEIQAFPRPSRSDLPLWLTTGGDQDGFLRAAELNVGVLTHLLGMSVEGLAENISAYRDASRGGHQHVAVMVHTLLARDDESAWAAALPAMRRYLKSALNLELRGTGQRDLGDDLRDELADLKMQEYAGRCTLIGTPRSVEPLFRRLQEAGVDEVVALVDFGPTREQILAGLGLLAEVARDGNLGPQTET